MAGFCGNICPTPHGVGGLKYGLVVRESQEVVSPTPHGVGGLKFCYARRTDEPLRPTPHGVGGLK